MATEDKSLRELQNPLCCFQDTATCTTIVSTDTQYGMNTRLGIAELQLPLTLPRPTKPGQKKLKIQQFPRPQVAFGMPNGSGHPQRPQFHTQVHRVHPHAASLGKAETPSWDAIPRTQASNQVRAPDLIAHPSAAGCPIGNSTQSSRKDLKHQAKRLQSSWGVLINGVSQLT